MSKGTRWSNPSVLAFAGDKDPLEAMTEKVREVVVDAMESGWSGPPFDPISLAEHMGMTTVPTADIPDARTVPGSPGQLRIEFNPNRGKGRMRYSVAHEIAHTLFPDCGERVRNRVAKCHSTPEEWELEALCNVGAAEILMPAGDFTSELEASVTIEKILDWQTQYAVSTEAMLIRVAKLSRSPITVFCASRTDDSDQYKVNYAIGSRSTEHVIRHGSRVPSSVVGQCTAIGFTAKGLEDWKGVGEGGVEVECVGLPPYPGTRYPRVAGLVRSSATTSDSSLLGRVNCVRGDATKPRGRGRKIIAYVVNDKAVRWGGGFARVVGRKWPHVQDKFRQWIHEKPSRLRLGSVAASEIEDDLIAVQMIAQHGYKSRKPGIRYEALHVCLSKLASLAEHEGATVHIPRIGCGLAGGTWRVVEQLIGWTLLEQGIDVTVYDLP